MSSRTSSFRELISKKRPPAACSRFCRVVSSRRQGAQLLVELLLQTAAGAGQLGPGRGLIAVKVVDDQQVQLRQVLAQQLLHVPNQVGPAALHRHGMGEGDGVQLFQRAGETHEIGPAQRVALLPFSGGSKGQLGFAHARKSPQHVRIPLFLRQLVQQDIHVPVAALHLAVTQRTCVLGQIPGRRHQAAAPLIHPPRHLIQRDALCGVLLCSIGQQLVHFCQQFPLQPGGLCTAGQQDPP